MLKKTPLFLEPPFGLFGLQWKRYPFLASEKIEKMTQASLLPLYIATALLMVGPLTSIGSLSEQIQHAFSLTFSEFNLVVSLPTLLFGLFSLLVPFLLRAMRLRGTFVLSLLTILLGSTLRLQLDKVSLLLGTFFIVFGITLLNVLMPLLARTLFKGKTKQVLGFLSASVAMSGVIAGLLIYTTSSFQDQWLWVLSAWTLYAMLLSGLWAKTFLSLESDLFSLEEDKTPPRLLPPKGFFGRTQVAIFVVNCFFMGHSRGCLFHDHELDADLESDLWAHYARRRSARFGFYFV